MIMKRRRNSVAFDMGIKGSEPGEFSHLLINYSGPSFSDLPMDIMANVLLRLSIKRIFVCKLVCKTWRDLISNPEFAKLHFGRAQAYPFFQISDASFSPRMLHLFQPDEKDFERKLEMCDHGEYDSNCECHVDFELDVRFKLPLRNLKMALEAIDRRINLRPHVRRTESNIFTRLRMYDHKYEVVNSCNGLLCLSSPSNNGPLVVCNPVTGEFISLLESKKVTCSEFVLCGFGFSSKTNEYKLVRIIKRQHPISVRAEVHTLGTETWRDVKCSADVSHVSSPTYLNGFLYWNYWSDSARSLSLITFEIGNECFGSVSGPPIKDSISHRKANIRVLGGELSISCLRFPGVIEVWIMKNNGTTNAWSKVFSISSNSTSSDEILRIGSCKPVKYLNDGALLMFSSATNSLIYKHPRKHRLRYFHLRGMEARMELIAHIPSFVSLKDALFGHNINVLNVKSRCAKVKLQNEYARIFVVENDT